MPKPLTYVCPPMSSCSLKVKTAPSSFSRRAAGCYFACKEESWPMGQREACCCCQQKGHWGSKWKDSAIYKNPLQQSSPRCFSQIPTHSLPHLLNDRCDPWHISESAGESERSHRVEEQQKMEKISRFNKQHLLFIWISNI